MADCCSTKHMKCAAVVIISLLFLLYYILFLHIGGVLYVYDASRVQPFVFYEFKHNESCQRKLPNLFEGGFFSKNEKLNHLPVDMLHNQKLSADYPTCGNEIFPWFYSKNDENNTLSDYNFLFLIKSAPKHIANRNLIRSTWGGLRHTSRGDIAVIFVIANVLNSNHTAVLMEENNYYGDMLQCNFTDSYETLHIKVISVLEWLLIKDINYEILTINDDDITLKLDVFYNYFDKHHDELVNSEHLVCGYMFSRFEAPIRGTNKWSTPEEVYSGDQYPYYCNGPFYTMTKPMAIGLACAAKATNFGKFLWEDVLVTGIFREKLGNGTSNIRFPDEMFICSHSESDGELERMRKAWKIEKLKSNLVKFLKANQTTYNPFPIFNETARIEKIFAVP